TSDNPRHHAPDMGLLYFWELPFLLYGIFKVWKQGGVMRTVLIGWLLIAPIPAAPTTGLPHAVRTLVFLPVFQIFTAIGIVNMRVKKPVVAAYMFFVVFSVLYYLNMYFVHQNPENSEYWQYGYADTVALTEELDKYEFRRIDWSREKRDGSILYVGDLADMPHGNVGNITFLNGKPAIELADQPNGAP
ncbi:MAG: hypothetical protein UY48_C0040G0009, partial [Candidatus Gottesmanbacteria bacterium GW2011_GWB1_49_7]